MVVARLDSLDGAAKDRIEALDKIADPAARAKEREKLRAEFAGLPSVEQYGVR